MVSPTQRTISLDDVVPAARVAFGPAGEVAAAGPLSGGSFGTVWWADLADGRETVFKTGPMAGAGILTYEAGMVEAEAEYLRLVEAGAPELPMPRLLYGGTDWMFMTRLGGVSMPDLPSEVDTAGVRFESGAAIARLHRVTGEFFGYSGARPRAGTWREAYHLMIEALLADAIVWDVPLPFDPDEIRAVVAAQDAALDTVTAPSLVHFDLWDGNVLSSSDGEHLTGMVDGERYLWGDPFIDFASPALFRDILDRPGDPFLRGYLSVAPVVVDDCVRRRVWLCQLYLYLVMIVEFPSRGMTFETDEWRWVAQRGQVRSLIAKLAG